MSNPVSVQTSATFLDFDEVIDHIQFDTEPEGSVKRKLQRIIDAACTLAQGPDGANRPFAPTQYSERHDGWSGEFITLYRYPFLQLVKGTENQSTGGVIPLPESTPENGLDGILIDYATSRLMRTFDGQWPKPFFPGARNIEITYVAGFNPLPPDVWMATMELVEYWFRNTQQSARVSTFQDIEWDPKDSLWPGLPNRIANVYESYRVITIG